MSAIDAVLSHKLTLFLFAVLLEQLLSPGFFCFDFFLASFDALEYSRVIDVETVSFGLDFSEFVGEFVNLFLVLFSGLRNYRGPLEFQVSQVVIETADGVLVLLDFFEVRTFRFVLFRL